MLVGFKKWPGQRFFILFNCIACSAAFADFIIRHFFGFGHPIRVR